MNINSTVELNNGVEIPMLGLGTYKAKAGTEAREAVEYALEIGYRYIDTATIYTNEEDVGTAVRTSGIPRSEIFITTKVWNSDQGYDKTLKAFDKSLAKLGMDYVDLYLIHWPLKDKRIETWRALERLFQTGKCRAIGVSNYMINHLQELLSITPIVPAVNQVEFSPYLYQKELLGFCNERNICIQAYSPLVRGKKFNDIRLKNIAEKNCKTPAQILIRWSLQHNLVVLPKSSRKERIKENADIFDFVISKEDMEYLNTFDENYRVSWDPSGIE